LQAGSQGLRNGLHVVAIGTKAVEQDEAESHGMF
jgi:hypothetical protein